MIYLSVWGKLFERRSILCSEHQWVGLSRLLSLQLTLVVYCDFIPFEVGVEQVDVISLLLSDITICAKNINFASHRPHNQRPLVSTAAVTIVSQQSRLCASLKTLYMSILHRSCMSSSHTLLSLPRLFVHSKHNWLNQSINQSVPAFDTHANSISVLSLWNMSTVITSLLLTL